jgi:hypothetical protein
MRRTLLVVVLSLTLGALLGHGFHANAADSTTQNEISKLRNQVTALGARVAALETGRTGKALSPRETYRRLRAVEVRIANACQYGTVVTAVYQPSAASPAAVQYTRC